MTDATVEPTVEPTEEATPEVAVVAEVAAEVVTEAKAPAAKKAPAKKADAAAKALPRLKAHYRAEIIAELTKEFGFSNPHQVPNLTKIVVNMGVGDAAKDGKLIDGAVKDLTAITGQRPQINLARKSIAQFKLREGQAIGAHVTLRGDRMWEFLDRLLSLALPRIRDFRGLSDKQFDGNGNYTFGLSEQNVFHEINQDNIDRSRGMDITVVTTARTNDEGRALLKQLGFPFQTK
jgi:large subunit ribosomal protein L5